MTEERGRQPSRTAGPRGALARERLPAWRAALEPNPHDEDRESETSPDGVPARQVAFEMVGGAAWMLAGYGQRERPASQRLRRSDRPLKVPARGAGHERRGTDGGGATGRDDLRRRPLRLRDGLFDRYTLRVTT